MQPDPVLLYHITHLDNLPGILSGRCLHCHHDYVPFYFAPRSPMLYAIHKNQVEGYSGGQTPIVHLVSSVARMAETGHRFVFTDGHATMSFSRFFTETADLDQVDWTVMQAQYWNDTPEDLDRKRRRQAEFLVYNTVQWPAMIGIGVVDDRVAERVIAILSSHNITSPVRVRRQWYY